MDAPPSRHDLFYRPRSHNQLEKIGRSDNTGLSHCDALALLVEREIHGGVDGRLDHVVAVGGVDAGFEAFENAVTPHLVAPMAVGDVPLVPAQVEDSLHAPDPLDRSVPGDGE